MPTFTLCYNNRYISSLFLPIKKNKVGFAICYNIKHIIFVFSVTNTEYIH